MKWIRSFLDWERRVIFREEDWSFDSSFDVDSLTRKVETETVPQQSWKWRIPKVPQLSGDRHYFSQIKDGLIKIRRTQYASEAFFWWKGFENHYYFEGRFLPTSGGFSLVGTYRLFDFDRILSLGVLNIFSLCYFLIAGILIGEDIMRGVAAFSSLTTSIAVKYFLLPVAPLGFYFVLYGLIGLAQYLSRESRTEFWNFLEELVKKETRAQNSQI